MKQALKAKWVEALRSGEFKQYKGGALKDTSASGKVSFCCLGVLCEISPAVEKHNVYAEEQLSDAALAYAGFTDEVQQTLISLNDGTNDDPNGASFKRIATYIEKNL